MTSANTATRRTTHGTDWSPETAEQLRELWDRLRDEAISESDRNEIDEIFARAMP
jgi:hypothetical protein